jgi:hypothetical protein
MTAQPSRFVVRFSKSVARTLECIDRECTVTFTVDAGSGGNSSICLEHHPSDWPRGEQYALAFRSAKEFLESCGYEVEVRGEA